MFRPGNCNVGRLLGSFPPGMKLGRKLRSPSTVRVHGGAESESGGGAWSEGGERGIVNWLWGRGG